MASNAASAAENVPGVFNNPVIAWVNFASLSGSVRSSNEWFLQQF